MVPAMKDKSQNNNSQPKPNAKAEERIAKVLARAGVGSRREVERMIADGRIKLDGKVVETPATLISTTKGILVNGNPIEGRDKVRLWRFHKTKGQMTTNYDPEGRPTVFDALPHDLPRVISIGRLDYNTEGLLLFTNDGGLARWLELPKTGWKRQYKVRVHGRVNEQELKKLRHGITIEGIRYGEVEAELDRIQGTNAWLNIAIREGKNREVRRIMEHLGLEVNRLIRTAYGPFELGGLGDNRIEEIPMGAISRVVPEDIIGITESPVERTRTYAPIEDKPEKTLRTYQHKQRHGKKATYLEDEQEYTDQGGRGRGRKPRDPDAPRGRNAAKKASADRAWAAKREEQEAEKKAEAQNARRRSKRPGSRSDSKPGTGSDTRFNSRSESRDSRISGKPRSGGGRPRSSAGKPKTRK